VLVFVAWLPDWERSRRHGETQQELEVATGEVGAAWALWLRRSTAIRIRGRQMEGDERGAWIACGDHDSRFAKTI